MHLNPDSRIQADSRVGRGQVGVKVEGGGESGLKDEGTWGAGG